MLSYVCMMVMYVCVDDDEDPPCVYVDVVIQAPRLFSQSAIQSLELDI